MNKIISFVLALLGAITAFLGLDSRKITIDASCISEKVIGNKVSNVNVWEMGTQFYDARNEEENDIYEFVEYVQLMQCTGGNEQRDLFADPLDRSITDDYDFSRLIKNCRGILSLGAKPCLKLGNIPLKYSTDPEIGAFEVNVRPPYDYDMYYKYISAAARALVDEFGADEVLKWHFTVFTEYENADWFKCDTPRQTAEEFFKIYDYSVQALKDNIGEDVYVGAHSMTTTEGLWDEAKFIRHCAEGTNYATGQKGTKINCLSASYYHSAPGEMGKRKDVPHTIDFLRKTAEKYGLTNLDYGIDEGRVLVSSPGKVTDELLSRTVGFQWQAAFDAHIFAQCIENDIGYFSSWSLKSDGLNSGNPTLSFHIAKKLSEWKNSHLLKTKKTSFGIKPFGSEVKALAAVEENTLRVMAYNYKDDIDYSKTADACVAIKNLPFADGRVKAAVYTVDENCNYFDEWLEDREKYGIGDECFDRSPDDANIGGSLTDPAAREIYFGELRSAYAEKSRLIPTEEEFEIKDGTLTIKAALKPNTVVFYEIEGITG